MPEVRPRRAALTPRGTKDHLRHRRVIADTTIQTMMNLSRIEEPSHRRGDGREDRGRRPARCGGRADGRVTRVRVTKSLDAKYGLDESATRAARSWRFVPGQRDGKPVPVEVALEMSFTMRTTQ
jgi:TonB family protein